MNSKTVIGVLFRNNAELVAPFFYFLRKSMAESANYPIIALDNGSTDGTNIKLIDQIEQFDSLTVQVERENAGIARGRNLIIKAAQEANDGKYTNVVLMDSDVFVLRHGAVQALVDCLRKNKAGLAFGETVSFYKDDGKYYTNYGVSFCAISAQVFRTVGLFDERFEMFYDDSDLFNRVAKANLPRVNCPDAKALHIWGQTVTVGSEGSRRAECLKSDKEIYRCCAK